MKKNLILLVALFVMQMVSASDPSITSGDIPIMISNTFGSVNIQSNFNYITATGYFLKVKNTGVYYIKTSNALSIQIDSLKKDKAEGSFIYQIPVSDSVPSNGVFRYYITNLQSNTSYRAIPFIIYEFNILKIDKYILPSGGLYAGKTNMLVYGKEITFKTRIVKPIITCDISNLTSTSVTLSGKITGDSITSYGLNLLDTVKNSSAPKILTLNTGGSYTHVATYLKPNNTYKFEFFATNSAGTTKIPIRVKTLTNTDVNDNAETNFKVYPNPSNGRFNVSFDNSAPNNIIKIFDLIGKVVYLRELQDTKTEIDLTDKHLKGFYLVKVFNANGVCLSQSKLVLE